MSRPSEDNSPLYLRLHASRAAEMCQRLGDAASTGEPLPAQFASPTTLVLATEGRLGPDWAPESYATDPSAARPEDIVLAAQELGILDTPSGVAIAYQCEAAPPGDTPLGHWRLETNWGPVLTLATDTGPTASAGAPYARGIDAVPGFLKAAVDEGNALLERLYAAAPIVLARSTSDPAVLACLADSADAHQRWYATANAACPDEARVLAALRDRTENGI